MTEVPEAVLLEGEILESGSPDDEFLEPSERRWVRHECELEGDCQAVAFASAGRWPVRTVDVSVGGVGFLVGRRFEPHTLLSVELWDAESSGLSMPLARVCRVAKEGNFWLLGCAWQSELDASEVEQLAR